MLKFIIKIGIISHNKASYSWSNLYIEEQKKNEKNNLFKFLI